MTKALLKFLIIKKLSNFIGKESLTTFHNNNTSAINVRFVIKLGLAGISLEIRFLSQKLNRLSKRNSKPKTTTNISHIGEIGNFRCATYQLDT